MTSSFPPSNRPSAPGVATPPGTTPSVSNTNPLMLELVWLNQFVFVTNSRNVGYIQNQ